MANKDAAWELVQIKGLTAWANSYLSGTDSISNMETDLIDGVKLCLLVEGLKSRVEELSRKPIGKWTRKPAHRMQKVENANVAISFLSGQFKVKVTTGAEDIVGNQDSQCSNLKMVLGLFWATFRKTIGVAEGTSVSEEHAALLEWVRDITAGYKNVDIKGMKDSWGDGMAFNAMLHKAGVKFDYDALNPANGEENLKHAFRVAEEHFKIPQLLEIEDLIKNSPDDRSVAFYLNLLKHAMQEFFEKNKIKMGAQALQEELAQLRAQLEALQLAKQTAEEELARLRAHDEEMTEKLRLEEMLRLEEKSKFEEQMSSLNSLLQEEQDDGRKADDEIKRLRLDLEEAQRARSELEELRKKLEGQGGSLAQQLAEETSSRQRLEAELEEMRKKLAAEAERRKNRSQAAVELEAENAALKQQALIQSRVRAGLDVLRVTLMEHLEDVYRYREVQHDDEEARDVFNLQAVLGELKGKSFEDQLQALTQKLGNENSNIQRLIHIKDTQAELNDIVDKSGWIELKGASAKNKEFEKKWFVLQGANLMYFRNDNSDRPQGSFKLSECELHTGKKEDKFEFVLNIKAGDKQVSLGLAEKKDRDSWRVAISGSIARVRYLAAIKLAGAARRVDTRVIALCRAAAGSITDVVLDGMPLGTEEITALSAVLRFHNSLHTLSLQDAGLSDSDLKALSKAVGGSRVAVVRLSGNPKLTGTGLSALQGLFETSKGDIKEIHIARCALDDVSVLAQIFVEGGGSKLAVVDLSNNQLKDGAMQAFAKTIGAAKAMSSVQLSANQLTSGGANTLAAAISSAPQIRSVNLSKNAIGDEGAKAIASAATKNENVSTVNLSECGVTSAGAAALLASFKTAEGLNALQLNGNALASGAALAVLSEDGAQVSALTFARSSPQ